MRWRKMFFFFVAVLLGMVQAESMDAEAVLDVLSRLEARIPGLYAALADAEARGLDVAYPRADVEISALFIDYGREDVAQGRLPRAAEVAREIEMLLDRAAREMETNRCVPRLGAGPIEVRDGVF